MWDVPAETVAPDKLKPLLPGYDVEGAKSANYNSVIDTAEADPISGTVPLRSYLCEVSKASA